MKRFLSRPVKIVKCPPLLGLTYEGLICVSLTCIMLTYVKLIYLGPTYVRSIVLPSLSVTIARFQSDRLPKRTVRSRLRLPL